MTVNVSPSPPLPSSLSADARALPLPSAQPAFGLSIALVRPWRGVQRRPSISQTLVHSLLTDTQSALLSLSLTPISAVS